MEDPDDDPYETWGSFFTTIEKTLLTPPRILLSRTSLRAYLRTFLLFVASIALFVLAVAAYASFYYSYVPTRGFTLPVHLAFDESYLDACAEPRNGGGVLESAVRHMHTGAKWIYPAGTVRLARGSLATGQKYDVRVELDLPRSEQNLGVGNFMVEVSLLGIGPSSTSADSGKDGVVLASASRPAMLTYRSWLVDTTWRVSRLPWYLLGWRVESERVSVKVLEGVQFENGWRNIPQSVKVEVRSGRGKVLQIYAAEVMFKAQFEGLRYIMYNHRIISLVVFTSLFWFVEMGFLLITWGFFTLVFSRSSPPAQAQLKREPIPIKTDPETTGESAVESLSDVSRTFPTFSRQPPLRYSAPRVKEEDSERALEELPPRTPGDADDEDEDDEDADFVLDEPLGIGGVPSDSGLGTSMDSSAIEGHDLVRRRYGGSGPEKRRD